MATGPDSRIPVWVEKGKVRNAVLLLIGLGAVGMELLLHFIRNGVSHIISLDRDEVSDENLVTSPFFSSEIGVPKVLVAARRAAQINPFARVTPIHGDLSDLGLGVLRKVDGVVASVDSRRSRLDINRLALFLRPPFLVDLGIGGETASGTVRIIRPGEGACLMCGWGRREWSLLEAPAMPCRLNPPPVLPSLSTIAATTAGMGATEILKLLSGVGGQAARELRFEALHHTPFPPLAMRQNSHCRCDHQYCLDPERLTTLGDVGELTLKAVWSVAVRELGKAAVLELRTPLIRTARCSTCGAGPKVISRLANRAAAPALKCRCGARMDPVVENHLLTGEDLAELGDHTMGNLGFPVEDILTFRVPSGREHYVVFS